MKLKLRQREEGMSERMTMYCNVCPPSVLLPRHGSGDGLGGWGRSEVLLTMRVGGLTRFDNPRGQSYHRLAVRQGAGDSVGESVLHSPRLCSEALPCFGSERG